MAITLVLSLWYEEEIYMAGQRPKLRLLLIYRMLYEETDENHIMSSYDLLDRLAMFGIKADRRSIYADVEVLKEFGVDIITVKGSRHGYFIGERPLELPEAKLLIDAVLAAKFISEKKSWELINKLAKMTDPYQKESLQRQLTSTSGKKTYNERIYYTIDCIYKAISQDRQVHFQYKKDEKTVGVQTSPWALQWKNDDYYVVTYDNEMNKMKEYLVSEIYHCDMIEHSREGRQELISLGFK